METKSLRLTVSLLCGQESWCTRRRLLMKVPWWRQPGTLALYFCLGLRTPSPSKRWSRSRPMKCWHCWTSTLFARECPSSVRDTLLRPLIAAFGFQCQSTKRLTCYLVFQWSFLMDVFVSTVKELTLSSMSVFPQIQDTKNLHSLLWMWVFVNFSHLIKCLPRRLQRELGIVQMSLTRSEWPK